VPQYVGYNGRPCLAPLLLHKLCITHVTRGATAANKWMEARLPMLKKNVPGGGPNLDGIASVYVSEYFQKWRFKPSDAKGRE
jgi:hypothetical protein